MVVSSHYHIHRFSKDLNDFCQLILKARQEVLHSVLVAVQDWGLNYTIAANHHVVVAAWNLLCNLVSVAFLWVIHTSFHWDVQ